MAGSRAIRAARAFVEVFMDDSKLQRGVKSVQGTLRGMSAGIRQTGVALVAGSAALAAPLLATVAKFTAVGDEVHKMSARTGVSTETLSQMGFALEQSGAELGDFQRGLKGMANFLQGAERELSTSKDTMSDLGLQLSDLESLNPDEKFLALADSIAGVSDPTRRAALAMDVFGRAGESMLPLLNEGPGGIAALRKEADSLGRTISAGQAAKAAALADAWNRAKSVFLGVAVQIGGALAPMLTLLADKVSQGGRAVVRWVQDHQGMIKAIAAGIAVVGGLGGALLAVSGVLAGTAVLLGVVFNPLSLLAGAAIAAGVAFVKFSGVASASVERLSATFGPLAERAAAAFQSIKDALSAGEYALAAKLLWLSIKEAFLSGILPLREAWVGFKQVFLRVYNEMATGVSKGFAQLTGFLAEKLIEVQGLFSDIDVEEIKATLTEDIERRVRVIEDNGQARDIEIEAQTVRDLAQLQLDLQSTRQELATAKTTAASAAETASAAAGESTNFQDLLDSLKSGALAGEASEKTRPKDAQQQDSKDLRSVSGFSELITLINDQGVEKQQLSQQQRMRREIEKLRQDLKEARRQGFVVA